MSIGGCDGAVRLVRGAEIATWRGPLFEKEEVGGDLGDFLVSTLDVRQVSLLRSISFYVAY